MLFHDKFFIRVQLYYRRTPDSYSFIADSAVFICRFASAERNPPACGACRYTTRYALQLHDGASRNPSSDAIKRAKGVTADTTGRPSQAPRSISRKIVSLSLTSDCPSTFSFPGACIWLCRKMKEKKMFVSGLTLRPPNPFLTREGSPPSDSFFRQCSSVPYVINRRYSSSSPSRCVRSMRCTEGHLVTSSSLST